MALGSKDGSPWRVPDTTPIEERLAMLDEIVGEGVNDPIIRKFAANAIMQAGRPSDPRVIAQAFLRLVQNVGYVEGHPGQEWYQSVRWTLLHGGDCKHLATLAEALMRLVGIRSRLVWIDQAGPFNHVSLQVSFSPRSTPDGVASWEWAEASVPGAQIGEHPYAAAHRLGDTYVHGWRTAATKGGQNGVAASR